jgi:F420H(2)-dependent quinone reductase
MSEHPSLTFDPYPAPPACINQTVKILLRSPLHVLMSHQTMLLTLQGRKTGKTYTVVVTYVQDGKMVFVLSRANWWKNLRGGAQVLLQLRGKAVKGFAEPVFDQSLAEQKITQIVEMNSREAKYFSVVLDNQNGADPASVKLSAQHFILIRIHLLAV